MRDYDRSEYERELEVALEGVKHQRRRSEASKEAMQRWLLATLVLINGAAMVAVLGLEAVPFNVVRGPLISFLGGAVLAILAGFVEASYHSLAVHYWAELETEPEKHKELAPARRRIAYRWLQSRHFSYFSLVLFINGCLLVAWKLDRMPAPSAASPPAVVAAPQGESATPAR